MMNYTDKRSIVRSNSKNYYLVRSNNLTQSNIMACTKVNKRFNSSFIKSTLFILIVKSKRNFRPCLITDRLTYDHKG